MGDKRTGKKKKQIKPVKTEELPETGAKAPMISQKKPKK